MQRTAPHNKELSSPKAEKPWSGHLREVDWGMGRWRGIFRVRDASKAEARFRVARRQ